MYGEGDYWKARILHTAKPASGEHISCFSTGHADFEGERGLWLQKIKFDLSAKPSFEKTEYEDYWMPPGSGLPTISYSPSSRLSIPTDKHNGSLTDISRRGMHMTHLRRPGWFHKILPITLFKMLRA